MAGRSTGTGARRGKGNPRSGNRKASSRSAAPAVPKKNLGWMGARPRLGRWASELRLKCKRQRLWIGTFTTPQQAALAYDAAVYCLYGTDIPKSRKFNFPYMPFPHVSEQARAAGIPVAHIRAIAENHARCFAVYVEPPPPLPVRPVAAAAPPLMVPVDASAAVAVSGGPDPGAVAPVADPGGMDDMAMEEFFNSFSPEGFDAMNHMMADISLF